MRTPHRSGAALAAALLVTGLGVAAGPSSSAGQTIVAGPATIASSRTFSTHGLGSASARRPPFTARVSVYNQGWQRRSLELNLSDGPSISDDGRFVVFDSVGFDETYYRVFLRDRWTGRTRVVSRNKSGRPVDAYRGQISGNGRYVLFEWYRYGTRFLVRDLHTHRTIPASVSPAGRMVFGSEFAAISADGRYVTFITPSGPHHYYDVFVRDMRTRRTVRVSVSSIGQRANGSSESASRVVTGPTGDPVVYFRTSATNLTPNHRTGLVGHNLRTGRTSWVGVMHHYDVSANGRSLAYVKPQQCAGRPCPSAIFVRNLVTGQTRLVSVDNDGRRLEMWCAQPVLSADGTQVAFVTRRDKQSEQVRLRDMRRRRTRLISVAFDGHLADGPSWHPDVSADGRVIAFTSYADNLVRDDTNRRADAFVRRLP